MITLQKTKHSQFCLDFFKKNKNRGLNVAINDFFLAKDLINQGYDPEINKLALASLSRFQGRLKSLNLKLVFFAISFNTDICKYAFRYVISSKKHKTNDLQIDGFMDGVDIPFVFFPQAFSEYFLNVLNEIPQHLLSEVSEGR